MPAALLLHVTRSSLSTRYRGEQYSITRVLAAEPFDRVIEQLGCFHLILGILRLTRLTIHDFEDILYHSRAAPKHVSDGALGATCVDRLSGSSVLL